MITLNQALISCRRKFKKPSFSRSKKLKGPHRRGVCIRIMTLDPKKPNSANRKAAKVRLSNGRLVLAAIRGQGHSLQLYATVLVRGGRTPDVPGMNYQLVRMKYDFVDIEAIRRNRRSKYSRKQPGKVKLRPNRKKFKKGVL